MATDAVSRSSTTSRLRIVEELLHERQGVQVAQLSRELGVSDVTVRRYLSELESRGVARRTHGGAVLVKSSLELPDYLARQATNRDEKAAIGRLAAGLVPDDAVVMLGGGTTALQVMVHLVGKPGLTILTSNLAAAAQTRAGGARVVALGGVVRGQDCAMVGEFARMALHTRYADISVIGSDGLSPTAGLTSCDGEERELVHLMLERTNGACICVADHTKFGVIEPYAVAGLDVLSDLVTDEGTPAAVLAAIEREGVRVHVARRDAAE